MRHLIMLMLVAMVVISSKAYCQDEQNLMIEKISGKVDTIDAEGGLMSVDVNSKPKMFFITVESDLYMGSHHMSSLDIAPGDQVSIRYINTSGKNNIISLVDHKVEG